MSVPRGGREEGGKERRGADLVGVPTPRELVVGVFGIVPGEEKKWKRKRLFFDKKLAKKNQCVEEKTGKENIFSD